MEDLVVKAQEGDKQAFTEIILMLKEDLYKIAKTRITNESDIEDAIQETMLEAYKSIKKLKDVSKIKQWIITILINKCNRIYRRKYKKDISIDEYNLEKYMITNQYKNIENDLNFYSLLKKLNYKERLVLTLYYMDEYSVKEIKEITKMNENTINTCLYRARNKIRIDIGGNLDDRDNERKGDKRNNKK